MEAPVLLQKITLRNMLRYKLRMTMMLVGIGCCTALMVTAFGVRDSMLHVGNDQFGGVQHYALSFSFTEGRIRRKRLPGWMG